MTNLTFIIPIRHQDNCSNWDLLVENLKQTIKSINNQSDPDWKCVIVANTGALLPELPLKFEVRRVNFQPNEFHERGTVDTEKFRDAVRLDKGKRVLEGMRHENGSKYFMVVDDDDLIHRKIAEFTKHNAGANGWYIKNGILWNSGGSLLMLRDNFHMFCGTSHIVRSDLIDINMDENKDNHQYVKRMLGSHIYIKQELQKRGNSLTPLPFLGAIYRLGHPNAHSKSKSIISSFIMKKNILKSPKALIKNTLSLRLLNKKLREEYFGENI